MPAPERIAGPRPARAVRRLLVLGGTAEAAELAEAAIARFGSRIEVINSLAGRVGAPRTPPGKLRVGGFGGAEGLARYLREERIDLVIDATHPFASRISAHARAACEEAGVPRLVLARPSWRKASGDCWIEVADARVAAKALPGLGRRAFLTVGARDLAAFAGIPLWFLVRLVERPPEPLPLGRPGEDYELVCARGPFAAEAERALMAEHRIDVLVSKASGGEATAAKITAARELGIPVVLIRRPEAVPGRKARSVRSALDWISATLARLDSARSPAD